MECPYCEAELVCDDWYGHKVYGEHYWIPNHWEKDGDIYHCPNYEGFEDEDEAKEYAKQYASEIEVELEVELEEKLEEIVCESACFNGSFYTDYNGNLQEGRPC